MTTCATALLVMAAGCSSATSSAQPAPTTTAAVSTTTTTTTSTTTPTTTTTTTTPLTAAKTAPPPTVAATVTTKPASTTTSAAATTVASTTVVLATAAPGSSGSSSPDASVTPAVAPDSTPSETTLPPVTTLAPNADIPVAPVAPLAAIGRKSGPGTTAVQQRLTDLGFWAGNIDGRYGLATTQAVMAFQKYAGLKPSASVDGATAAALTNATIRAKSSSTSTDIVEVDKTKQLLFIVHGGQTVWVLNTSTGSGKTYSEKDQTSPGSTITGVAITYSGHFKVNRERPDGWWKGDLGQIYRPKYFNGGEAIHGLGSVPNYPASHGCVRVSVPAMDFIWAANLIPLKTPVWVH
jgi:peptidoglycan hydrolase-like protein with peptidoglycan-binding domain